jgi:stage III sporulation protein AB
MLKIMGTILVITATSLWGIYSSWQLNDQYLQMQYIQKLICQMKYEIRYTRTYLEDAFIHVGNTAKEPYRKWLLQMGEKMGERKGESIGRIWDIQTTLCLKDCGLPEAELQRLRTLGNGLGGYDLELQMKNMDLYLEELGQNMAELRPRMQARMKLYHCLGILSGLFLSILLI